MHRTIDELTPERGPASAIGGDHMILTQFRGLDGPAAGGRGSSEPWFGSQAGGLLGSAGYPMRSRWPPTATRHARRLQLFGVVRIAAFRRSSKARPAPASAAPSRCPHRRSDAGARGRPLPEKFELPRGR